MLAELAEAIKTHLDALPPESWGTLKPGTTFPFELAIDADELVKCNSRKVYIMPVKPDYRIEDSNKRGPAVRNLVTDYTITVAILIPFTTFKMGDVASWSEVKEVMQFREKLELNIIKGNFGYNIGRVETEAPLEIQLNERIFLCVTDFVYEDVVCGST